MQFDADLTRRNLRERKSSLGIGLRPEIQREAGLSPRYLTPC